MKAQEAKEESGYRHLDKIIKGNMRIKIENNS